MIGRLRGSVAEIGEDEVLIDVMGVGYVVRCGSRTLSRLPPVGEEITAHIESQTREDGTRLYGFLTREERSAFATLQTVQGVGPKAALALLDVMSPGELAVAVAREDKAAVGRANGIGPRLAQRIVVELKDKPLGPGLTVGEFDAAVRGAPTIAAKPSASGEATAALMGLGIAEPLARRAVETAHARLGDDTPLAALIKAALQETAR